MSTGSKSHTELTRWNRAGLSRFRYVGGNAATYLERMRELLAEDFPQWEVLEVAEQEKETAGQAEQRMLSQYNAERRDWAWELLRNFARASHVLTEHIDAYANEAYLGPATQWDNLRRLVEMLDYHPAPPACASTFLILIAKEETGGKVAEGFQVKHTPPDGSKPVVFETLEDVEIDERLNTLRLQGYGRSPRVLAGLQELELAEAVEDLQIGRPVVLERESDGVLYADILHGIEVGEHSSKIYLRKPLPSQPRFTAGDTWIHVLPKESLQILAPLSGKQNAWHGKWYLPLVTREHDLHNGEVACVEVAGKAHYRIIDHSDEEKVYFDHTLNLADYSGGYVSRAEELPVVRVAERGKKFLILALTGDFRRLQGLRVADFWRKSPGEPLLFLTLKVSSAAYYPVSETGSDWKGYTLLRLNEAEDDTWYESANPQAIFIPPVAKGWAIDSYIYNHGVKPFPVTLTTEAPKKISAGDRVVVVSGAQLAWGRVNNVAVDDTSGMAEIGVPRWQHNGGGNYYQQQTRYYGHFKHRLRLVDWDVNTTPVRTQTSQNRLTLTTQDLPDDFRTGRRIYVEKEGMQGDAGGFIATITGRKGKQLYLDTAITAGDEYIIADTVLRGNVVLSGHGERKPDKVLGSGDGTRNHQSFILKVENIAFVADPSQATGVRADIDVIVSGQRWEQVSTLRDSRPADIHYTVRMTEEGYIRIGFGDGFTGRRLPTGRDNVRVSYRVGVGIKGNQEAGKLEKPVKPHRLVDKVRQPMDSNGGNDMEGKASLRETAPASLLSLERAVSLQDFANLAKSHSSIWDARAFAKPAAFSRFERIEVVAVPAGGGTFSLSLEKELTLYLQEHAVPYVRVNMVNFDPVLLGLNVTLRIDISAYDPERVRKTVSSTVVAHFKLSERRIGQAVYLSEIYKVVEGVEGVSSSTCQFDMPGVDTGTRVIHLNPYQILYLDEHSPDLDIDYEEAER